MQISARGIPIEVDVRGPAEGPPLLLIMGLGMQLFAWPDALVALLCDCGFRVVRFDNRDAGLSVGFDASGQPNLGWALVRHRLGLSVRAPYRLADLAGDAFGVLDALGIDAAHVCGASMGGMVAQHMAAAQPARVKSLVLMMTTSGARHLRGPTAAVRHTMLTRSPSHPDPAYQVERLQRLLGVIGSPAYPPDPVALRALLQRAVERALRPAGMARQLAAILADGDRSALLARIVAPTCVLHGRADPLVPPDHALDLQSKIAGATLELVDGMGHDLPPALFGRFVDAIDHTARRAS